MEQQEGGEAAWHDWVGELFEPVFGNTIDDLVAHEVEPKNKPNIKHVSVYDPEAIRKVYQKVHMMTVLDEEMRKQKSQQQQQSKLAKDRKPTPKDLWIQSVTEEETSADKDEGRVTVDLNQSCIWDSSEIGILREAYKTMKRENIEAMVNVRETVKRNKDLEKLAAEQQQMIVDQREKLTVAVNANSRYKIHCDSLQEEVRYCTAKIGAMEEVIVELQKEKSDMVKELHDNRVTTDKERMDRERIQMKLDTLKQEALAEKLAAEDGVKTMCRQVILDLQAKVKHLTGQLEKEKQVHQSTQKGLKHLRQHFASLSVQEILPTNAVVKDQVKSVQY